MTCKQLADQMRRDRDELLHAIEVAEHKTLRYAEEVAWKLSSGTATTKLLSTPVARGGLGHPYGWGPHGAAGPRGPIPNGGDAGMINVQTGEFLEGWEGIIGYIRNGQMTNRLQNETEHAEYIANTPNGLQIHRPILLRIHQYVVPVRVANLQQAFKETNR